MGSERWLPGRRGPAPPRCAATSETHQRRTPARDPHQAGGFFPGCTRSNPLSESRGSCVLTNVTNPPPQRRAEKAHGPENPLGEPAQGGHAPPQTPAAGGPVRFTPLWPRLFPSAARAESQRAGFRAWLPPLQEEARAGPLPAAAGSLVHPLRPLSGGRGTEGPPAAPRGSGDCERSCYAHACVTQLPCAQIPTQGTRVLRGAAGACGACAR